MSLSDIILIATGIVIAWQAYETRKLAEVTREKDQPLLDIEFDTIGAEVSLKNIGLSSAYAPSISRLKVSDTEYFDFDPLYSSRLPIRPGEVRKVWMHHKQVKGDSMAGFVGSIPTLKAILTNRIEKKPLKVTLQYSNQDSQKIKRDLYINIGGSKVSNNRYLYVSTTHN